MALLGVIPVLMHAAEDGAPSDKKTPGRTVVLPEELDHPALLFRTFPRRRARVVQHGRDGGLAATYGAWGTIRRAFSDRTRRTRTRLIREMRASATGSTDGVRRTCRSGSRSAMSVLATIHVELR
jgi:hypothetical protein